VGHTDVDQQSTDQLMIVDSHNACHFPAGSPALMKHPVFDAHLLSWEGA
jgi:hypothetical protein